MRIGLFTALFGKESLDEVIQRAKKLGVSDLELGTGNYPGGLNKAVSFLNSVLIREKLTAMWWA